MKLFIFVLTFIFSLTSYSFGSADIENDNDTRNELPKICLANIVSTAHEYRFFTASKVFCSNQAPFGVDITTGFAVWNWGKAREKTDIYLKSLGVEEFGSLEWVYRNYEIYVSPELNITEICVQANVDTISDFRTGKAMFTATLNCTDKPEIKISGLESEDQLLVEMTRRGYEQLPPIETTYTRPFTVFAK